MAYFSTHVDATSQTNPLFPCNVVVPVKEVSASGHCEWVANAFRMTDAYGWQFLTTVGVGEGTDNLCLPQYDCEFIPGVKEPYYKTTYGSVEAKLRRLALLAGNRLQRAKRQGVLLSEVMASTQKGDGS